MVTFAKAGQRMPSALLGCLNEGRIEAVDLIELMRGRRAVVVGIPGAFTPICTKDHVPAFVANAERLKALGLDMVVCIAPNDPWTLDAWARELDPKGAITFLSDGNMAFAKALGVIFKDEENFLGRRPRRYLMVANDGVIERLSVELAPLALSCTSAAALEEAA